MNKQTQLKSSLKEKLLAKLTSKPSKASFNEYFLSNKNPKKMLSGFTAAYEKELLSKTSHGFLADNHFQEVSLKNFHKIKERLFNLDDVPNLTNLEMTQDFLKYKVFVNQKVSDWVDKFSRKYPDLYIWKRSQQFFLSQAEGEGNPQGDKFEDKYQQLKIYKTIFQRNSNEVQSLNDEFQKIRFESFQARKLMESEKQQCSQKNEEQKRDERDERDLSKHKLTFIDQDQFANLNDNILFYDDSQEEQDDSETQELLQKIQQKSDEEITLKINEEIKESNKYQASEKNYTLIKVIQDNKKILERKILPLLEMFKVESAFFKEIQNLLIQAVNDKKQFDQRYCGKIKLVKKDVQTFENDYRKIEDQEILELITSIERILKNAKDLQKDLDLIKLANLESDEKPEVIILSGVEENLDDEDPDEKFFK